MGRRFSGERFEFDDFACQVLVVGDGELEEEFVELVLGPGSRVRFLPVPVVDVCCVGTFFLRE